MLQIDIRSLKVGYHEFNLTPMPEEVELDPDLFQDLRVDVGMDFDGKKALVTLDCSAVVVLVCDRTQVQFEQPVKGRYSVLFAPSTGGNDESDEKNVRVLEASDEDIDITAEVRDTVLLAIPTRKVAPGAEDAEIPTVFGNLSESEIDPRWEALRELKEQADWHEDPDD